MKKKVVKRNKAFIGAIVGAVGGIAGSLIGGAKKRKQEAAQLKQQQEEQNKQETYAQAQAINSGIADQSYVEDYQKKVTLKMGGKRDFTDRVYRNKRTAQVTGLMNRRKKAELGTESNVEKKWTKDDTSSLISGVGTGISNAISAANGVQQPLQNNVNTLSALAATQNNNKIAQDAKNKRVIASGQTDVADNTAGKKYITSATARYGTKRKKAGFGAEAGSAAGGIGSLVGSLFQKTDAPKQVKKAVGFSTSAPKIGLQKPDYQNNPNQSAAAAIASGEAPTNTDGTPITNDANKFKNRDELMRCGGKRLRKRRK